MTAVERHVKEIHAWVAEACENEPGLNESEVEGDVLQSYIAAYINGGEGSVMARQIRAKFGR